MAVLAGLCRPGGTLPSAGASIAAGVCASVIGEVAPLPGAFSREVPNISRALMHPLSPSPHWSSDPPGARGVVAPAGMAQ